MYIYRTVLLEKHSNLPSIERDVRGGGDGREPINDVHDSAVFRAPSRFRDVAGRVHEGRHLKKKTENTAERRYRT